MASSPKSSSYMPHVNGLRALAILGVLFYHLQSAYCPAGYFGVDVFLVISGFLLIRSLAKEDAASKLHYGSYLLKKAWRIIPSWFVLTMATCIAAILFMDYIRLGGILKTARYSSFFWADYQIDKSGNYFNPLSQQNPLLHLWYLSITEQLYIIAPLLLLLLTRLRSRVAALVILVLISLASLTYYVLTTTAGIIAPETQITLLKGLGYQMTYYHLIPRLWEIMAGGAVLLLPTFEGKRLVQAALALLGLAGVLVSYYLYQTSSPSVYLTVAATLLLIKYGNSGLCGAVLRSKPMQAIGTISFSLYLWHWPIMVFWKYFTFDQPGAWDEVGMVVLSLLMGTLTWYFIERLKMPTAATCRAACARYGLLLTIPVVLGLALAGKYYYRDNMPSLGFTSTPPFEEDPAVLRAFPNTATEEGRKIYHTNPRTIGDATAKDIRPFFLLMGDSHSFHLYDGLFELCKEQKLRGIFLNNSVMPYWYLHHTTASYGNAQWTKERAEALIDYLKAHEEIRYVVISQFWDSRLITIDTGDHDWRTGKLLDTREAFHAAACAGLRETCVRLNAIGKKVILLKDTPYFDMPSPIDEWNRCIKLGLPYKERIITEEEHLKRRALGDALCDSIVAEGLAICLDPATVLKRDGCYPARIDDTFVYMDAQHLSLDGSRRAARYLLPILVEMAKKDGIDLSPSGNAP